MRQRADEPTQSSCAAQPHPDCGSSASPRGPKSSKLSASQCLFVSRLRQHRTGALAQMSPEPLRSYCEIPRPLFRDERPVVAWDRLVVVGSQLMATPLQQQLKAFESAIERRLHRRNRRRLILAISSRELSISSRNLKPKLRDSATGNRFQRRLHALLRSRLAYRGSAATRCRFRQANSIVFPSSSRSIMESLG